MINYKNKNPKDKIFYFQKFGFKLKHLDFVKKCGTHIFSVVDSIIENKYDKIIDTCLTSNHIYSHLYWVNNFREIVHKEFKLIFDNCLNKDKFEIKDHYIISISTDSQKNKGLTDYNFQDIISDLILIKPNIKFALIGKSDTLLSKKLKTLIKLEPKNVKNLLDQDKNIEDVLNILKNGKKLICRNSGLVHISGLLNKEVIFLKFYIRGPTNWFYNDFIFNNVEYYNIKNSKDESTHRFYKEEWFPISDKCIRIIEYKKLVNYDVIKEIIKVIN